MEKLECYEKDNQIIQEIRKIILSKHPIVENRMDVLFDYPQTAMDIDICFLKREDNEVITQIMFLDGTVYGKSSITEELIIKNLISNKTVSDLISFVLSDHDVIKSINKTKNDIKLSFVVDMKEDNMKGISCGVINLILDFYHYQDHEELLNSYLKTIVNDFFNQLRNTDSFKKEYKEYCLSIKEKIINSLTEEDLHTFINLLSNEDLCKILLEIPHDQFIQLYDDFENIKRDKSKIIVKK